jgi:hypothetical protein
MSDEILARWGLAHDAPPIVLEALAYWEGKLAELILMMSRHIARQDGSVDTVAIFWFHVTCARGSSRCGRAIRSTMSPFCFAVDGAAPKLT